MPNSIAESPERFQARRAGGFYLLAVLSAIVVEASVHGRLLYAAGLVPIACFLVTMKSLYQIFKPVSRSMARIALSAGLVGLAFEGIEWQPHNINVALVFHGLYCLGFGYLTLRSAFLPRILGPLMAIAGLAWLTLLSPQFADSVSPYNIAAGFLGEGSLMLWLLVKGGNISRKQQAGKTGHGDSSPVHV